ncbi:hypothetical protein E4T56_gene13529 [Termitomyces sp. T112]|nr:hypothetical protein E4T56_gene13529 [Termitomyces sp. T112]KAH0579373.1 hypothetical protein H2248_003510 [Termitomyces sp. 'cryptogamus']
MADTFDTVLTPVTLASHRRPQRSVARSDVDQLSDEAILELVKDALEVAPTYFVFKLTPITVAKERQDMDSDNVDAPEANVLDFLFAETTIPVPRVRRVVDCWIVMVHIPGSNLAEIWPSLSIGRKISIAFTLRRYIRQLRRLKASTMTPLGPLST